MKILFDRIDEPGLNTLEVYERRGGYESLRRALRMAPDEVLKQLVNSGIRGRGGAGFRMGQKISFLPHGDMDKYLVCNADESEPGTFKDREIMQKNPHMLIEGILIASWAGEISRTFLYIRGEYAHQADILEAAIAEARDAGYIGEKILGSDHSVSLVLHRGAGAYICGEETGLLDSLEGKRGNPRLKPPFPAIEGLYHGPTLINNVETLATVPAIIRMGGEDYAKLGTETSTGTKLVSISGDVQKPGNYEIPLGTPFKKLLELAGGVPEGRTLKAVIPGGSSAPVLPASIMNELTMDYDAIAKAGSMLGSGAVIVMDDSRSMVHSLLRLSYFYMHESCGQCTPCREGTGWLYRMVERIANGEGRMQDIDLLNSVSDNIQGRTICALGDAAAMPVRAMIKHFKDEFIALIGKAKPPVHAGKLGSADSVHPGQTPAAATLQYGMATAADASAALKQTVKP